MDYKDLRDKFVELSGRYDLTNTNGTDNGADFFINSGQKYLDRMCHIGKMKARHVQSVSAGTTLVKTLGLRAIHSVWVYNSSSKLIRLTRNSLETMREYYAEIPAEVTQGTPAYFAPALLRPYADTATFSGLSDVDDLVLGTEPEHYLYNGVVIQPPPDTTFYISIWGLFYSPTLSATLDGETWTQTKSIWTEAYPDTLLHAALYKLEAFYRNTEGMKDYLLALQGDITGLDYDVAEEESAEVDQMEG